MLPGINSSVSALIGLNKKAANTANNVANINTPGFKSSRVSFQDVPGQTVSSASGSSQVGHGVTASTISTNQSQGPLAGSDNPTDLGISGQGYFILRQPGSETADTYSRDGGFGFDTQGNLVSASGAMVQGWQLDPASGDRQGNIGDITVPKTTAPGPTQEMSQVVNLDARLATEETPETLFNAWDGRNATGANPSPAIDPNRFEYQTSTKIYDSQGNSHDVTIYYDRTENDNEWEFMVTTDPLEDQRALSAEQQAANPPFTTISATDHKGAGALLYGTMQFSTSGDINSISAYEVPLDGQLDPSQDTHKITLGSEQSQYSFATNFTGAAENQAISLNFGASYSGQNDTFQPSALSSTQYANSSTTIQQNQDGHGAGFLQGIAVDTNGVVSASYSNGRTEPVAQVALANFANPGGLSKAGGNLYTATSAAGTATTGAPNSSGLGGISPTSFELSNVDLAKELTDMMVTKHSFKANINMIKSYDEMLGSLLDIKT